MQTADTCESTDMSAEEKELVFSNWPEYIDVKGKRCPRSSSSRRSPGIDVTYNTDVNDNNEFFAKVATSSATASRSAATSSR